MPRMSRLLFAAMSLCSFVAMAQTTDTRIFNPLLYRLSYRAKG